MNRGIRHKAGLSVLFLFFCVDATLSTLSTIFKQQTGKNISSYIEDIRIKEAMRLLRTTDWTINQISEAIGYLTVSTFCRAFRRNTGYNTSTYKSMVGE